MYAAGGSYGDAPKPLYNAATGGVIAEGFDQVKAIDIMDTLVAIRFDAVKQPRAG